MDLALNNLQRLICHKYTQPPNQPTNIKMDQGSVWYDMLIANQSTDLEPLHSLSQSFLKIFRKKSKGI